MTRLEYWIMADTQYGIHSPFVFEMYRKVLFATVGREVRSHMGEGLPEECAGMIDCAKGRDKMYHDLVYKLRDHYGMRVVCYDGDEAVLEDGRDGLETVKVVCRPHRCRARELRWQAQQGNAKYNVSIDMYDAGVLMMNHRLHPQHFVLK